MPTNQMSRRKFIGASFAVVAGVGAGFGLYAMKQAFDPLPNVIANSTTVVDLSGMVPGKLYQVWYRKQPVFIMQKTSDMKVDKQRDVIVKNKRFLVVIGVCTHLGCIPIWKAQRLEFVCPCHGAIYNSSGVNIFGPATGPLVIPPFKIKRQTLILGEAGEEYEKLMKA